MEFLTYAAGMLGMQDSLIEKEGGEDRRVREDTKKRKKKRRY